MPRSARACAGQLVRGRARCQGSAQVSRAVVFGPRRRSLCVSGVLRLPGVGFPRGDALRVSESEHRPLRRRRTASAGPHAPRGSQPTGKPLRPTRDPGTRGAGAGRRRGGDAARERDLRPRGLTTCSRGVGAPAPLCPGSWGPNARQAGVGGEAASRPLVDGLRGRPRRRPRLSISVVPVSGKDQRYSHTPQTSEPGPWHLGAVTRRRWRAPSRQPCTPSPGEPGCRLQRVGGEQNQTCALPEFIIIRGNRRQVKTFKIIVVCRTFCPFILT